MIGGAAGLSPALMCLNVHHHGIAIAGIFWGLWLFPFGMRVIRSGFMPRLLGMLLIAGGCSYLVDSAVALLIPQYRSAMSGILMLPLSLGEFGSIFWLLIKGVRPGETNVLRHADAPN